MTLYSQISANVQKTWAWIFVFFCLILGFGWAISAIYHSPDIFILAVAVAISQVWISYFFSDKISLAMTGARKVEFKESQELYRLVENLCIAAGLPTPEIYIIADNQPNAFATGRDPKHSSIALTSGLFNSLEKNEIEAVVSHELAHIQNRDTFLQAVMLTLVGVISLAADIFWRAGFRRSRQDDVEGSNGPIFFILGIIFVIVAPILGKLMQLAVSRQREFLADASGSMITRNPEALASALEKISQYDFSMRRSSPATEHLFIASPLRGEEAMGFVSKLFSTHPPIEERIKELRRMNIQ